MLGMEERSRMKNLDRSTATPGFVTLTSVLLFTSSLVIGVSYAVPSQSPPSNLPAVKITAPNKGQQVPVASNILVSGTSFPPPSIEKTHSACIVSVSLNGVKPYQKVVATGPGGISDYSTWRYAIASNYATIKPGQNKITAKISCAATPSHLTKFNSVNVTGIGTSYGINGQNGKNGANGTNGVSVGGSGGSAIGGNGGNGGNGGRAIANDRNGGVAIGGKGGNGGNGGSANGGNGGNSG
jgi:hypothetical protein